MWTDDHADFIPPVPFPTDMPPLAKVALGVLSVGASVGGVFISHTLLRNLGDTISAAAGVVFGVVLAAVVLVAGVAACRAVRAYRRGKRRECSRRHGDDQPPLVG